MSDLIATLRAVVRDELSRRYAPELGVVTQAWPRDGDGSKSNHQVNLKLRSSGVELQRVPVAVSRLGLSALPNEGDLMLVAFVGGDLNAPVAVGCVYDDTAHPPVAQAHEVVYQPPDDEESGVRRFHLELQNGSTLTVDDESLKITLGDTAVEVGKDGDVTIKAKGKIRFESQADIELEAQGAIKLTAQGDLAAKGMSATIEGQSAAKLKGAQVSLAGMTQFAAS
ncbi:MAG TPA: phage baseplate assembly protein V [Longimicrobium sp.]